MRTLLLGLLVGAAGVWVAGRMRPTARVAPEGAGAGLPGWPPGEWPGLGEHGFIDPHPDAVLAIAFEEEVWGGPPAHVLSSAGTPRA